MKYRKLDEEETKRTNAAIEKIISEIKQLEYSTEYNKLMLDKGLDATFEAKRAELRKAYKLALADLDSRRKELKINEQMLSKGVEVKEKNAK